jgi:hypothetical protein
MQNRQNLSTASDNPPNPIDARRADRVRQSHFIMAEPIGTFARTVSAAAPGDWVVYHVGAHCGGAHRADARAAYDAGLVLLATRRNADGAFEYIAIRTKQKVISK